MAQLNLAATALIEALECSCPEQNLTVTRRALDILSLFYAYFSRPSDSAYQFRGDERLFNLLEYAAGHYAESIPISDAARLCHLQPEYFCRYFKQKTGETFLTYLAWLRLAHVLSDLKRSDDSIQRIAERNGFSNQKSFIRAFRAQFGCTPTELRTRLREEAAASTLQNCNPRFVTG